MKKMKQRNLCKRGFAWLLTLAMCLGMLQVTAFAEGEEGSSRDNPKVETSVTENPSTGETTTTTDKTWSSESDSSKTEGSETTTNTVQKDSNDRVISEKEEVKGHEETTTTDKEEGNPVISEEESKNPDPNNPDDWTSNEDKQETSSNPSIDVDLGDLENSGEIEITLPIDKDKPLQEGQTVSGNGSAGITDEGKDNLLDRNSELAQKYKEYEGQLGEKSEVSSEDGKTSIKKDGDKITVEEKVDDKTTKTTVFTKTENGYTKTETIITEGEGKSDNGVDDPAFDAEKAIAERLKDEKAEAQKNVGETTDETGKKTTVTVEDVDGGYKVTTTIVNPDGSIETEIKTVTAEAGRIKTTVTTEVTKEVNTSKEELADMTDRKATVTIDGVKYESIDQWMKDFGKVTLKYGHSGPDSGIKIKKTDGVTYVTHEFVLIDENGVEHTVYCSDLSVMVKADAAYTKILLDDLKKTEAEGNADYLKETDFDRIKAILQATTEEESKAELEKLLGKTLTEEIIIAARQAALWKYAHSNPTITVDDGLIEVAKNDGWWAVARRLLGEGFSAGETAGDKTKEAAVAKLAVQLQNQNGDVKVLHPGQELIAPVYTVSAGDSNWTIAKKFGINPSDKNAIAAWNKLNPHIKLGADGYMKLDPGMKIIVPNGINIQDQMFVGSAENAALAKELYDLLISDKIQYDKELWETPETGDAVEVVGSVITVKGDDKDAVAEIKNSADVALTLQVKKGWLGDIIVIAKNGDKEYKQIIPRDKVKEGGSQSVTFEGIELGEAGTTNLTFNISGTREMDEKGVYIFVTKGDYKEAQTMIGVENKQESVNMNFNMKIEVEEAAAKLSTSGSSESFTGEKKEVSYKTDFTITRTNRNEWESVKSETFEYPGGGNPGNPPTTPSNPSNPSTPDVTVPDSPTPLADVPEIEVPEEDVPLADTPEEVEIDDPEVPLGDVPRTGDVPVFPLAVAVLGICGTLFAKLGKDSEETK